MDGDGVFVRRVSFQSEDSEVEEELLKAIDRLGGLPDRLREASSILVKPNIGAFHMERYKGRLRSLRALCNKGCA